MPKRLQRHVIYQLRRPILDLGLEFIHGDLGDRCGELHWTGFTFDLAPEKFGQGKQLVRRQGSEVALGQLGFHFLELLSQGSDAGFAGGKPLFVQGFDVDGAVVLDVELKFAAPGDEGRFGELEFVGDAGEAPAFGAEMNEALLGLDVIHGMASIQLVLRSKAVRGGSWCKDTTFCERLRRQAKGSDKTL